MDKEIIIEKIQEIIQLDIDASYAYEQALMNIENKEIHSKLSNFRNHHLNHINILNNEIENLGGTPIKILKNFKRSIIQGFISLSNMQGIEGTLNSMEQNEIITNNFYKKILLEAILPEEINNILESNLADEQKHLEDIRIMIKMLNTP